VEVAKVGELPDGSMKKVEVKGKEILVGNWEGKHYAISDRCGHVKWSSLFWNPERKCCYLRHA